MVFQRHQPVLVNQPHGWLDAKYPKIQGPRNPGEQQHSEWKFNLLYIYIVTQLASLSNFLSSKNVKNAEFNHPRESPGSSRSDASPGRPAARSVSFSPSGRCLDNFDWSPAATAAQLGQWMLRWNRGPSWELLRCK